VARRRIAVIGAGVAGSIVSYGLSALEGVELVCLERVGADDHDSAGTGLNIGPNAIKTLAAYHPELATALTKASLPWRRWTIDLVNGTRLMDLDLLEVADNPGIRIRWAELYRLLRTPLEDAISFGSTFDSVQVDRFGRATVSWRDASGAAVELADVDLVIACDGRYSSVRNDFFGPPSPTFLGVAMYRLLFLAGEDCPIDDYGQWFNGPNRLLAFQLPGGFVYCAGSFPHRPRRADPGSGENPRVPASGVHAGPWGALARMPIPCRRDHGAVLSECTGLGCKRIASSTRTKRRRSSSSATPRTRSSRRLGKARRWR
jgi:2-polyprenyl-6-methoxyphenol hydroxylase-like FAD-dependent oxidoreductase